MSSLSWLAFSEAERRRTLDVVQMLGESETRDELGVGRVRDALADLLFPGLSTIQTRARYFLLVPWIYANLEWDTPFRGADRKLRRDELTFLRELRRMDQRDEPVSEVDTNGLIGRNAGDSLVQLPSEIYWQGLSAWGIRQFRGTRASYHRLLEVADLETVDVDDDGEPLPGSDPPRWDAALLKLRPDELTEDGLALDKEEATYLFNRVTTAQPRAAFSQLLVGGSLRAEVPYVWDLPERNLRALSSRNREIVDHAHYFSLTMNGAALLYNHMLAVESERAEVADRYERAFETWADEVTQSLSVIASWAADLEQLWNVCSERNQSIPGPRERRFIEGWIARVVTNAPGLLGDKSARDEVEQREVHLKGPQARLRNPSALEAWKGATGASPLSYRWPVAQGMLREIDEVRKSAEDSNGS